MQADIAPLACRIDLVCWRVVVAHCMVMAHCVVSINHIASGKTADPTYIYVRLRRPGRPGAEVPLYVAIHSHHQDIHIPPIYLCRLA